MTFKRFFLSILTIFVVARVLLSLGSSLGEPQVQARLELYQVNLSLQAALWEPEESNLVAVRQAFIGEMPYATAQEKYEEVLQQARESQEVISSQAQPSAIAVRELQAFANELNLKIGILQVAQGEIEAARDTWRSLGNESEAEVASTAEILARLWQDPPKIAANTREQIEQNLTGWFRDRALARLYQSQGSSAQLQQLQAREREAAQAALTKLAIVGALPGVAGLIGTGLLIFLLVQRAIAGKKALLATNGDVAWETPWDWEITWQVLVVGFFFFGQFILPIAIALSGIDPSGWDVRGKAFFVLVNYVLMAASGLFVLYWSIKAFFPLPQDWLRWRGSASWIFWGLGGYLVAVPIVIVVSLLNQQIWQGQGGSNPLLFLALQAQDRVALAVFLGTASLAAPLFEEIVFRGFLLPSLTRYVPVWGAIALSSLVFSLAHLSLSEVLPLTALGMVLGVVYTRSRNLLAPILLHSLWNGGTLLSLFLLGGGNV